MLLLLFIWGFHETGCYYAFQVVLKTLLQPSEYWETHYLAWSKL